jgi:hypothetical protein
LAEYADLGVDRVVLQGVRGRPDPGLVDTPAADCDALGLLESDAGALDGDAEAADGTGQRTLPRPAMGNSRSSRPSRTP